MTKNNEKSPEKEKQQALQQKYMEYQVLEQQIKQMQEQLEKMESQTNDLASVEQSICDISKSKPGGDVLVPVSNGIFFKATLKDTNNFLINVGSGIVVKKELAGTKEILKEQMKEIEDYKEQVIQQLAAHVTKYQEMENDLKSLIGE